ncbi:MAG: hypothetical protein ACR2NF_02715 [Pirellulales bacterium]
MMGDIINCMAETREGRCARCLTCRIVYAIENLNVDNHTTRMVAHLDRIGDELGVISEVAERF